MLIFVSILILIITLALRKNVERSKVFAVFNMISLISIAIVLLSIFVIGGWEGMGIGVIAGSVNILAFIGMLITLLVLKRNAYPHVDNQ